MFNSLRHQGRNLRNAAAGACLTLSRDLTRAEQVAPLTACR